MYAPSQPLQKSIPLFVCRLAHPTVRARVYSSALHRGCWFVADSAEFLLILSNTRIALRRSFTFCPTLPICCFSKPQSYSSSGQRRAPPIPPYDSTITVLRSHHRACHAHRDQDPPSSPAVPTPPPQPSSACYTNYTHLTRSPQGEDLTKEGPRQVRRSTPPPRRRVPRLSHGDPIRTSSALALLSSAWRGYFSIHPPKSS